MMTNPILMKLRSAAPTGAHLSFLQLSLLPLFHTLVEESAGERRKPLSLTLSPLTRGEGIQKCMSAKSLQEIEMRCSHCIAFEWICFRAELRYCHF
jgi:hypothetical protein